MCNLMTMQLSERAKQLIPQARIVSFATWKNLYSDEVIAIFQEADNQSRYLTDEDLERIKNLDPHLSLMLEQARLLREQAPNLVADARKKVLADFPHITELGNDLYPPERAEACWRDFGISYAVSPMELQVTVLNLLAKKGSKTWSYSIKNCGFLFRRCSVD
jgi:allophycocyanin-B